MAFNNTDMSVIAYANGWTLWHYRTKDDNSAVSNPNYFPKRIVDLMAVGDVIYITSNGLTTQRQVIDITNGKATLGKLS